MISKDDRVRALIAEQASEWFVANDDASAPPAEAAALNEWLRASPVHVEEFLGVAALARDLRGAASGPEFAVEALLERAHTEGETPARFPARTLFAAVEKVPTPRWRWAVTLAGAAGVAILGGLLWKLMAVPVATPATATLRFATRHGEQRTYRLADQSILHLNTDSAVAVRLSPTERVVVLDAGEASFEVTHEAGRPFQVVAGAARVLDLGTRFDVRLEPEATLVTVVEGRVAVALAAADTNGAPKPGEASHAGSVSVAANQQLSVSAQQWPAVPIKVDAQRATAWLRRQIAFDHEPLGRVAAEINRYAAKPIEIVTPKLRDLQISGVFSTDDEEELLAFLRSLDGVRVEVTATQIRISQK
jgi:transmembrane sensor